MKTLLKRFSRLFLKIQTTFTIEHVLITAINQTLCDKDALPSILKNNIETLLSHENGTNLVGIGKRLKELQTELVELASSKSNYEEIADEFCRLRDEKQKVQLNNIGRDELKNEFRI